MENKQISVNLFSQPICYAVQWDFPIFFFIVFGHLMNF